MNSSVLDRKITGLMLAAILLVYGGAHMSFAHDLRNGVNPNPHYHEDSTTRTVAENLPIGTKVGAPVSAHSLDHGQGFNDLDRYVLRGEDAAMFTIDAKTGQLRTNAIFDYETKATYTVEVVVQDGTLVEVGLPMFARVEERYTDADSITVTIEVADVRLNMPDASLQAAVRKALQLGADVPITEEALLNLKGLWASNMVPKITDLTGLEHAVNLTHLSVGENDIGSFGPISNLTGLVHLGASSNSRIWDIRPLSNLTNLKELWLGWNSNISNLAPLSGLTELRVLYLVHNKITDVRPLSGLVNLKRLSLSGNPSGLDISVLSSLIANGLQLDIFVSMPDANLAAAVRRSLGLSADTLLTRDALLNLTSLEIDFENPDAVSADGNGISDLTGLEHAKNLSAFILINETAGENDLSDLSPLSELTKLIQLRIDNSSGIEDFSPIEENLTNLETLYLDGNDLSDISFVSALTKLRFLSCAENSISDLSPLSGLTNLRSINFRGNTVSDLSPLSGLTNLEAVLIGNNIGNNKISNVSPLSGLTKLRVLYLRGNSIRALSPLSKLTNLVELDLYENQVWDVSPLAGLTNLTDLLLGENPILDTSPLYPLTQGNLTNVDITITQYPPWDVNEDGVVDEADVTLVWAAFGQSGTAIVNPRADVNGDGTVNDTDVALVRRHFPGRLANIVDFPDAKLAWYVRKALELTEGVYITKDDLLNLTELRIAPGLTSTNPREISDLTGLEHATNLTTFVLIGNESIGHGDLSDLSPLSGLTKLNYLELDLFQGAVDLNSLSQLTSLTTLSLTYSSGIDDFSPIQELTNLEFLILVGNDLSTISFLSGLTKLKHLSVDGNSISDLSPLSGLRNLTGLGLSENAVSDLSPLSGLTNLAALVLNTNKVINVSPLSKLTALVELNLGSNSISDVTPLSKLTNLVQLNLSENEISNVSPLVGLTNLTDLWLNGNPILDTSPLYPLTQGNLTTVDIPISQYPPWDVNEDGTVNLTDAALVTAALGQSGTEIVNPRTDVNGDGTVNDADVALVKRHLDRPEDAVDFPDANLAWHVRDTLGLSQNAYIIKDDLLKLTELHNNGEGNITNLTGLEHATNLQRLGILDTTLSDLSPLSKLTKLTRLELGGGKISDLKPLSNLTTLVYLELRRNAVSDLSSLSKLTNLTTLDLTGNDVSNLSPLSGLSSLKLLWVGENSISDVSALSGLTNLEQLGAYSNDISDISALSGLTKLQVLGLAANNSISDISALSELTALTELYLTANSISDISALSGLTALTELYLSRNSISDISALSELTALTELYLNQNSISDVSALSGLTNLTDLGLKGNSILDTSPLYPLTQDKLTTVNITISQYPPWDVNEDGAVDETDAALVTLALGQSGAEIVNPRTDVNGDGIVDQKDLTLVTEHTDNEVEGAPSVFGDVATQLVSAADLENLDRGVLERTLAELRAVSDGSVKYQRAIELLEAFLAASRPEATRLLANYPNPFNPETWLPYELAKASDVRITIYDTRGHVIRRLDLGHQVAGYYTSRSRAVYWDGRNALGERVASGIYFYQLEADNTSVVRKMVILK